MDDDSSTRQAIRRHLIGISRCIEKKGGWDCDSSLLEVGDLTLRLQRRMHSLHAGCKIACTAEWFNPESSALLQVEWVDGMYGPMPTEVKMRQGDLRYRWDVGDPDGSGEYAIQYGFWQWQLEREFTEYYSDGLVDGYLPLLRAEVRQPQCPAPIFWYPHGNELTLVSPIPGEQAFSERMLALCEGEEEPAGLTELRMVRIMNGGYHEVIYDGVIRAMGLVGLSTALRTASGLS